jgi:hypothetical protein
MRPVIVPPPGLVGTTGHADERASLRPEGRRTHHPVTGSADTRRSASGPARVSCRVAGGAHNHRKPAHQAPIKIGLTVKAIEFTVLTHADSKERP